MTETFSGWLEGLRDKQAVARIVVRIERLARGHPGDIKSVGAGVSELRIPYGPGYRLYLLQRGALLVILLCGGDKSTQTAEIVTAKKLASEWKG
jgi:putative addiction module killer protein